MKRIECWVARRTGGALVLGLWLAAALAKAEPSAVPPDLQEALESCYSAARAENPGLEVHGLGQWVGRGHAVLGVSISLPEAPALERCIRALPERGIRRRDPGIEPESFAVGGFAVDLGGPRPATAPGDFPALLADRQRELRALVEEVVARGKLGRSDPAVREILEGKPRPARAQSK